MTQDHCFKNDLLWKQDETGTTLILIWHILDGCPCSGNQVITWLLSGFCCYYSVSLFLHKCITSRHTITMSLWVLKVDYLVIFWLLSDLIKGLNFFTVPLSFKVLNEYFHNVCELDLVFNFYKVRTSQD